MYTGIAFGTTFKLHGSLQPHDQYHHSVGPFFGQDQPLQKYDQSPLAEKCKPEDYLPLQRNYPQSVSITSPAPRC